VAAAPAKDDGEEYVGGRDGEACTCASGLPTAPPAACAESTLVAELAPNACSFLASASRAVVAACSSMVTVTSCAFIVPMVFCISAIVARSDSFSASSAAAPAASTGTGDPTAATAAAAALTSASEAEDDRRDLRAVLELVGVCKRPARGGGGDAGAAAAAAAAAAACVGDKNKMVPVDKLADGA